MNITTVKLADLPDFTGCLRATRTPVAERLASLEATWEEDRNREDLLLEDYDFFINEDWEEGDDIEDVFNYEDNWINPKYDGVSFKAALEDGQFGVKMTGDENYCITIYYEKATGEVIAYAVDID